MAVGLNKILLIGNLTKDPELKFLPNGTPKAELRLATSRTYVTNGEKREDTCYVDVIAWSRTAENAKQYLNKGSKIFVEGRLDYQEWEGQDGSKRSKHQVVADRIQFLDSRPSGQGGGDMGEEAMGGGGGYSRPQRQYGNGNGTPARASNYGPRAYGQGGGSYGAPHVSDAAPAAPSSPQAETGLAQRGPAPGGMGEAMGIAEDDIPF